MVVKSMQVMIRNRISIYQQQTSVLKEYYSNQLNDTFYSIDGERKINKIFNEINKVILNYKNNF